MTSLTIATIGRRVAAIAAAAAVALTVAGAGVAAAGDEPDPPAVTLRGFVRAKDGAFTVAEPPGATLTKPGGINNRGDILFKYLDADGIQQGAVLTRGVYRPIEFPGAAVTAPLGQNDRGDVVGNYLDQAGASHGFLLTRHGTYTTVDNPNADDDGLVLDSFGTIVTNINNRGEMVGSYTAGGRLLGFLRDRQGRFTTIEPPGAVATLVTDINDRGDIVGDSSEVGADALFSEGDGDSFLLDKRRLPRDRVPGCRPHHRQRDQQPGRDGRRIRRRRGSDAWLRCVTTRAATSRSTTPTRRAPGPRCTASTIAARPLAPTDAPSGSPSRPGNGSRRLSRRPAGCSTTSR